MGLQTVRLHIYTTQNVVFLSFRILVNNCRGRTQVLILNCPMNIKINHFAICALCSVQYKDKFHLISLLPGYLHVKMICLNAQIVGFHLYEDIKTKFSLYILHKHSYGLSLLVLFKLTLYSDKKKIKLFIFTVITNKNRRDCRLHSFF